MISRIAQVLLCVLDRVTVFDPALRVGGAVRVTEVANSSNSAEVGATKDVFFTFPSVTHAVQALVHTAGQLRIDDVANAGTPSSFKLTFSLGPMMQQQQQQPPSSSMFSSVGPVRRAFSGSSSGSSMSSSSSLALTASAPPFIPRLVTQQSSR
jgi:hypothetical protein